MYEYKRPKGKLHRVSIREWDKAFSKRGRWPFVVAEVYLEDDSATVQYVATTTGKVTLILLLPLIMLYCCVECGIKEGWDEYKKSLFDKKYGRFSSDRLYKNRKGSDWDKLMDLIGEKNG